MRLAQLKQLSDSIVALTWDDGHDGPIATTVIRDSCPCAECKGESVLFQSYVPPAADKTKPGRYKIIGASPIGSYALKFSWGDGHDLGLYTWEHLRSLCGCSECVTRRGADGTL
ncbi:MAG: gamma-butyrobetaine hydroxylase-like domain-containing protein [Bacteroidota bacterium]